MPNSPKVRSEKTKLFYLSSLTLFGMSAFGILLIIYVQHKDVSQKLLGGKNYYLQGITGLFFGSLAAILGLVLINGKFFRNARTYFDDLLDDLNPSLASILFYAFSAAVGEEILFRAGIQGAIGIWPAALLFVILHGYIVPKNIPLVFYNVFLVVVSAGFGYLFKHFGLVSAIVAHFVYDIAMFCVLKYAFHTKKEVKPELV